MQNLFRTWMLPEGVVEALPTEAEKFNRLTQTALDGFARWGYQPLRPPIMEYADTFISHPHSDNLLAQTIQFKDPKSGKQLGLRADMTPQIARLDAHYLSTDKVARYAYAGELVRSYPTGRGSVRNPTVVGAELLGSDSQAADLEIVSLLIDFLNKIKLPKVIIELGNVDIVVQLLQVLGVDDSHYSLFFEAFANKDSERLQQLITRNQLDAKAAESLLALTQCYGDITELDKMADKLQKFPEVIKEINYLKNIAGCLQQRYPALTLHIDLADVYGYGYHNGFIFSAYVEGVWQAIARGGRYDSFGNHFAEDASLRPSTGFSCYLNLVTPLLPAVQQPGRLIACALNDNDHPGLAAFIEDLRQQGDTVIAVFPADSGSCGQPNRHCTHTLTADDNGFHVNALSAY